jgi:5-methyltetrahydrofolate--homocysteine methyltransferase
MKGKYPEIFKDEHVGAEAKKLHNDALALLEKVIEEKWLTAKGVVGLFRAEKQSADSIVVRDNQGNVVTHLEMLRQQVKKADGQPNHSLADFIKPGNEDYIGAFAVTIDGIEHHLQKFVADHDDYNKIMLQAIADRLAEAFAELLHRKVRTELWGYMPDEQITVNELIAEHYTGIRPAPGYPACPDHTEKLKLFDLLQVTQNTGISLTESLAMYPSSSVCGWYFSHPQSVYFGVNKILDDQLTDYTKRKQASIEEMKKWLSPILD